MSTGSPFRSWEPPKQRGTLNAGVPSCAALRTSCARTLFPVHLPTTPKSNCRSALPKPEIVRHHRSNAFPALR
jgi:hypothetical protein